MSAPLVSFFYRLHDFRRELWRESDWRSFDWASPHLAKEYQ